MGTITTYTAKDVGGILSTKRKNASWKVARWDSMSDAANDWQNVFKSRGSSYTNQPVSSFTGNKDTVGAIAALTEGDMSAVSKSDALLSKLEDFIHITASKFMIVDDVAGAVPNVPAYLAGHPLTMRRRQRTQSEQAPLTLVLDTCVSAGITPNQIMERGVAILAMVRALSAVRPIELYIGWTLGMYGTRPDGAKGSDCANSGFVRIDTAPLDLARSCYALTHPSFLRVFGFEYGGNAMDGNTRSIPWGFNDSTLVRLALPDLAKVAFGENALVIPGMHFEDKSKNDPLVWLFAYLKAFGGEAFAHLPGEAAEITKGTA